MASMFMRIRTAASRTFHLLINTNISTDVYTLYLYQMLDLKMTVFENFLLYKNREFILFILASNGIVTGFPRPFLTFRELTELFT